MAANDLLLLFEHSGFWVAYYFIMDDEPKTKPGIFAKICQIPVKISGDDERILLWGSFF